MRLVISFTSSQYLFRMYLLFSFSGVFQILFLFPLVSRENLIAKLARMAKFP